MTSPSRVIAYAGLGVQTKNGNSFIRPIWAQPSTPRNVSAADCDLALWYMRAGKSCGLRRVFHRYIAHGCPASFVQMMPEPFQRTIALIASNPEMALAMTFVEYLPPHGDRIAKRVKQ